jgi:DNA replication and repair protein RecF
VPGVVLVVGPNGAGKTNLLEALHVGTQGFSPRTRSEAQLIRFGEAGARIALRGVRGNGVPLELEVTLRAGAPKQGRMNGAPLRVAEQLRTEIATLVFTPERLAVVKGGPGVRRAYFDRTLGRLFPARASLPALYGAALGQRNAALRRAALGISSRDALEPWTEQVAELASQLVGARRETIDLLAPTFDDCAAALGLPDAGLRYAGEAPTVEALAARLERDLERGSTGIGPHLEDVTIVSRERDLRLYGSQGEQRLAVLALLLAEAEILGTRRGEPPLLLLDDVLSELDEDRRAALVRRLPESGQTLISATSRELLPAAPAQRLEVRPGQVRVV